MEVSRLHQTRGQKRAVAKHNRVQSRASWDVLALYQQQSSQICASVRMQPNAARMSRMQLGLSKSCYIAIAMHLLQYTIHSMTRKCLHSVASPTYQLVCAMLGCQL